MTQKKLEIIGPYTPEHEGPVCTRDAEIGRLRRVLSDIHDDCHDLPEFMRLEAIIKTVELALKGGAA